MSTLERFFKLSHYKTNIKTEVVAGLTTFVSASWILFVNPHILGKTGMDMTAVFLATISTMFVGAILMGVFANLPVLVATAIGANTWFAFTIVSVLGYTWQQGLAAVLCAGILFFLFSVLGIRRIFISAFSESLQLSISVGIGLFIMTLGLRMSGIVVYNKETFVTLGNIFSTPVLGTIGGLIFIMFLETKKKQGGLLLSIFLMGIVGYFTNESSFTGIVSFPHVQESILFSFDFSKVLTTGFWSIVLSFFLLDILDSTGSLVAVLKVMGVTTKDKRVKKGLLIDSSTTIFTSMLGSSPATVYVESATGISAGGRTGLTSCVTALAVLCMVFFSPILTLIPSWGTCSALIYVGYLMFRNVKDINWNDMTEALPAFITIILMPSTASITAGIGIGVFFWLVMALFTKKFDIKKHWILVLVFLSYLAISENIG